MVREVMRDDYTQEEIKNLENGKCWCGKPRAEFDKRMRVYCCKAHQHDWYMRTETWSSFKDNFLTKKGKKCAKCGCTPESLKADGKSDYNDWMKEVKANPEAMKVIEKERINQLNDLEEKYQKIMDDDYLIRWEFSHTSRQQDMPAGLRVSPKEDNWIDDRFEVDHIEAICLGGDQWNEENLQVLCYADHKVKTKEDMSKLKAHRRSLQRFDTS